MSSSFVSCFINSSDCSCETSLLSTSLFVMSPIPPKINIYLFSIIIQIKNVCLDLLVFLFKIEKFHLYK